MLSEGRMVRGLLLVWWCWWWWWYGYGGGDNEAYNSDDNNGVDMVVMFVIVLVIRKSGKVWSWNTAWWGFIIFYWYWIVRFDTLLAILGTYNGDGDTVNGGSDHGSDRDGGGGVWRHWRGSSWLCCRLWHDGFVLLSFRWASTQMQARDETSLITVGDLFNLPFIATSDLRLKVH